MFGTPRAREAFYARARGAGAISKQPVHTRRQSKAGQIDRLETLEVASEPGGRPEIAAFTRHVPASPEPDVDAAEGVCARRPSVRLEHVREDRLRRRRQGIHE